VSLEGNVVTSLRRIARAHTMLVFDAEAANQAYEVVCHQFPPVIVVQVGSAIDEMFKFIRLVTTAPRPVPLIAAATRHSTRIEQAVLQEGARYYLPSLRRSVLEHMLIAILQRKSSGWRMGYRAETTCSA